MVVALSVSSPRLPGVSIPEGSRLALDFNSLSRFFRPPPSVCAPFLIIFLSKPIFPHHPLAWVAMLSSRARRALCFLRRVDWITFTFFMSARGSSTLLDL